MLWNIISVTVLFTLFSAVFSENTYLNETIHIRVKRGKYYSYPSRFYKRPPNSHPVKGPFSLTPPPGYMMDEEEPPYPGPGRPHDRPKVSKKPTDGLRDEDINNIVKYLSKQDLDKLIDMASEKGRYRENSVERRPYKRDESRVIKDIEYATQGFANSPYKSQESDNKFTDNGRWISQENSVERRPYKRDENSVIKDTDYSTQGFLNGPYKNQESDNIGENGHWISQDSDSVPINFKPQEEVYQSPFKRQNTKQFAINPQENNHKYNGPYAPTELLNYIEDATQSNIVYVNQENTNLHTEESMQNNQISYLNAYIHHEINDLPKQAFSDNQREEALPRPVNLREDDFDISYTNNVPTVVKRPSYKVENFGELPLMSNAYKLDTVSSYKVPHYTVTSNSKYSPPPPPPSSSSSSSSSSVPLEPAPPISAAKEQSDAHLKATKIWTHRSQGTAYTLHNDGTLSLERQRLKNKYRP